MIAALFPNEVKITIADPVTLEGVLYPQEDHLIAMAVDKRKQEFKAGRLLARKLLEECGIDHFPILMGNNREPIWPENISGSIAHSKNYCVVAVAQKDKIQGIGIDVEYIDRVIREVWDHICTEEELLWVFSRPKSDHRKYFALIFSAKESIYKCLYPLTKQWIGFEDVSIFVSPQENCFKARLNKDVGKLFNKGTCLRGTYQFSDAVVYTGVTIENV